MKRVTLLPQPWAQLARVSRTGAAGLTLTLLLGAAAPAAAQTAAAPGSTAAKTTGRITGTVQNAATKQPVEFATVALLAQGSEKAVLAGACDEKGAFVLGNVPVGEYTLAVSFVGYQAQRVPVVVTAERLVLELPPVLLAATATQLSEVKVTGERALVESKVDRIVYNADKDLTNSGGTAADVLQKAPLLTVDLDGNLQLRGSSNIRVLVNGKPSTLLATNLAEALKQIPADQIKSVEVITAPSAKYDAEGTAGVVNIILKKNNLEGKNGNLGAGVSNRNAYVNGNFNQRRGKLGLNTGLGANPFYNIAKSAARRRDYLTDTTQSLLLQNGRFTNMGWGFWGNLGLDYDLTPKDVLSLGVQGNYRGFLNDRSQYTSYQLFRTEADALRPLFLDAYNRDIDTRDGNGNVDVNLGYTKQFAKPKQELSVLGLYSLNLGRTRYQLDQQRGELTDYREKSRNDNHNREITLQADYVQPLDSTQTLETGVKTILRHVDSDYRIEADSVLDGRGFRPVPQRSNEFGYDQNVYAGYASYGFALGKKWTFKAGSRLEHTRINGEFRSSGTSLRTTYTNLAPNLMAAWAVTPDHTLKLSYSRRIQRPGIWYLNPYVNTADRRNVSSGNPTLNAELTDAYELSYTTFIKKSSVTLSSYWRQTNNAIESVARLVPGNELLATADTTRILYTTYRNLARNANYGLSAFGSTKLTDKWSLSGNVNFYWRKVSSPALGLTNSGGMFNLNLNSSWQFEKGWSAQFFAFANSRQVTLQGRNSGYRIYSLGAKKEFWDKKANVVVAVINPFNARLAFRNDLVSPAFDYENNSYFYNRQIRVSFFYRFGKMDNQSRPKKTIQNDDQKQGGGSNG
ncbi:TonB-dependent receptor family protein [Hymenobacter sp. 15J16-1T3B]|uniref:outer membrane beta-barrel family protein n=1 Tax=Hymenobacter sp. 15J16-1T3B TaxID=2886941 RepID=UPI001D109643|nr:outer membrane beta-barrel family protein [Hymenobacter sp. 15J16-1T3B]MCC3156964.1 TonB-dependent receptor family protein [Hymenobacter sp. 15J16-1T3B]